MSQAALAPPASGAVFGLRRAVLVAPKILVGGLVLGSIAVMLAGVFLRYVVARVTNYLDVDPIQFFWVEEVGELMLCWLTLVGAAIGIGERAHFTLALVTHRLPDGLRRAVHLANHALIALFGGLLAWEGFHLVMLNAGLGSPALEISLGWLYASAVVSGVLMVLYAASAATGPTPSPDLMLASAREQ